VKVCFPLLIVISVICMCILKVSCSVFLNWIYWARGNFSGEPGHIHIGVCASPLWSAGPVLVYLVASLIWVAGRYGFSVYLA